MQLVTGATGIVGAHLVCELLHQGFTVRAIARGKERKDHLFAVMKHYGVSPDEVEGRLDIVNLDIQDVSAISDAMNGIHMVYHAAAMVSFTPHEKQIMWKVNVEGTANLVNAAIENRVKRFCHVSSVASIGRDPGGELSTEKNPFEEAPHVSPYSYTKYYAELEIQRGVAEGLDAFMVNPSIIVGPGREGESSMAMVDKVRQGIGFYPPGTAAIVDARDVAKALIIGSEKACCGERYILVGEHLPFKDLFALISRLSNIPPPERKVPKWALNVAAQFEGGRSILFKSKPVVTKFTAHSACSDYRYDNTKARHAFSMGFRGAEEAIANTIAFKSVE